MRVGLQVFLTAFALALPLATITTVEAASFSLDLRTTSEPASPHRAAEVPGRSTSLPADLSQTHTIDSPPSVSSLSTPPSSAAISSPTYASQPPSPKISPGRRPAHMVTPPTKLGWKGWFKGEKNPTSILMPSDYHDNGHGVRNPAIGQPKAYRHYGLHDDRTPGTDIPFLRKAGFTDKPKYGRGAPSNDASSSTGEGRSLFKRPKQKRNPAYWFRRHSAAVTRTRLKKMEQEYS